ncbi:MAG: hypothetical protein CSA62_02545 [Planctomycetota bacterium]|nr:MAG: hypothetical protein CSA62_02545 [Planctomycetota bacterium]
MHPRRGIVGPEPVTEKERLMRSFLRRYPHVSTAAFVLLAASLSASLGTAQEQKAPARTPAGYPKTLVHIPGGSTLLGLDADAVKKLAQNRGKNRGKREAARAIKLMARSLGKSKVRVPDFLIGRTEVTNKQYAAFIKAVWPQVPFPFHWWKKDDLRQKQKEFFEKKENRGRSFVPDEQWRFLFNKCEWEIPKGMEDKPVTWITFDDALAYCAWAGLRLPTEAEWQRAYEGDKNQHYLFGDKWSQDWLKQLRLENLSDRRLKTVGTVESNQSPFGVFDMMGNAWEWTMSSFRAFENFQNEGRRLKLWAGKEASRNEFLRNIALPLFDPSKRILRGGSYLSVADAAMAFHGATRLAVDPSRYTESFGFRTAKSMHPAFDACVLWARRRFHNSALGSSQLDLPGSRELRHISQGKIKPSAFGQIGIERWEEKDKVILGHQMISFVATKEAPEFKRARDWAKASANEGKDGYYGRPLAALFTTERFKIAQGLADGELQLDKGIYTFEFRGKGLPLELHKALLAGAKLLKRTKGKRLSDEAIAELAKKAAKKAAKKKKKKKKKKKGESSDPLPSSRWMKVVDAFGIPDEVTRKYPKVTIKKLTLNPGGVTIPADKNVILVRHHKKGYVGWLPTSISVKKARLGSKDAKIALEIDKESGKITFIGGPKAPHARSRLIFKLPIYVSPSILADGWTSPYGPDRVVAKGLGKSKQGKASASPRRRGK